MLKRVTVQDWITRSITPYSKQRRPSTENRQHASICCSILNGIDIGTITTGHWTGQKSVMMNGLQRTSSLMAIVSGDYIFSKKDLPVAAKIFLDGKRGKQFNQVFDLIDDIAFPSWPSHIQEQFLNSELTIDDVRYSSGDQADLHYIMMNCEVKPLNREEIATPLLSDDINQIKSELGQLVRVNTKDARMQDKDIVNTIFMIILKANTRSTILKTLSEMKSSDLRSLAAKTKSLINLANSVIPEEGSEFNKLDHYISVVHVFNKLVYERNQTIMIDEAREFLAKASKQYSQKHLTDVGIWGWIKAYRGECQGSGSMSAKKLRADKLFPELSAFAR